MNPSILKRLNMYPWNKDEIQNAIRSLTDNTPSDFATYFKGHLNHFRVDSGKLFFHDRCIIPEEEIDQVLEKLYTDPLTGISTGRDRFYLRVKKVYLGISLRRVQSFLKEQESYQLHYPAPGGHEVVQPIVTKESCERWQMDLIDFSPYSQVNNGFSYILTVTDCFSKKVWARPLKNKSGVSIATALREILETTRSPKILQSDSGGEFKNKEVDKLCAEFKIEHIFSLPYRPQSNGGIQRFKQTLKKLIFSWMTQSNTNIWYTQLENFLLNYNTSRHSTTKMEPNDLHENPDAEIKKTAHQGIKRKAQQSLERRTKSRYPPIQVGDKVRLSRQTLPKERRKQAFGKSYKINWSVKVYTVTSVSDPQPGMPQYKLVDEEGNDQKKRYYRRDLQKIKVKIPAAAEEVEEEIVDTSEEEEEQE